MGLKNQKVIFNSIKNQKTEHKVGQKKGSKTTNMNFFFLKEKKTQILLEQSLQQITKTTN